MSKVHIQQVVLAEAKRKQTTVAELYYWAVEIASLTSGRSGFFGIMFPDLLPVMLDMLVDA
jgi:hypothetical protein